MLARGRHLVGDWIRLEGGVEIVRTIHVSVVVFWLLFILAIQGLLQPIIHCLVVVFWLKNEHIFELPFCMLPVQKHACTLQ